VVRALSEPAPPPAGLEPSLTSEPARAEGSDLKHTYAVLFDLDGTLIDSRAAFASSLNHALVAAGLPPRAAAELQGYLGPPIHETLTEHMQVPGQLVDAIVAAYREHYVAHGAAQTAVYPGVVALLERLYGRVRLAVATSKPEPSATRVLEQLGLGGFFETICGPRLDAVNEPKAATVGQALSRLSARAPLERAVMVGDRLYDVLGARQHGLPTIGVLWGVGSEAELRAAGAAALAAAPAELPALLGRWAGVERTLGADAAAGALAVGPPPSSLIEPRSGLGVSGDSDQIAFTESGGDQHPVDDVNDAV